jgi:hypothetical protein
LLAGAKIRGGKDYASDYRRILPRCLEIMEQFSISLAVGHTQIFIQDKTVRNNTQTYK